jgi:hypothetical protein
MVRVLTGQGMEHHGMQYPTTIQPTVSHVLLGGFFVPVAGCWEHKFCLLLLLLRLLLTSCTAGDTRVNPVLL